MKVVTRRQWRGRDRALLRQLKNVLLRMQARDDRMLEQSDKNGTSGFYFAQNAGDPVYLAMTQLSIRIGQCNAATT